MKYQATYTFHGKWKHKEYFVWSNMKQRCTNKKSSNYEYYGGRGIKVCARWQKSFTNFLEDVGKRPGLNYTLDRINNDGDYEPGNVRWATKHEQMANQRELRKANTSGYSNISWHKDKKKWVVRVRRNGVAHHLGTFSNIQEAITARDIFKLRQGGHHAKNNIN